MFDFYEMQMLFSSVVYQLLAELAPRAQPWPGVSCEYTANRLALHRAQVPYGAAASAWTARGGHSWNSCRFLESRAGLWRLWGMPGNAKPQIKFACPNLTRLACLLTYLLNLLNFTYLLAYLLTYFT